MAKLTSVTEIGVYVRDQKKAKDFYTRKLGLKGRMSDPKFEYLLLGATKGGDDAGLGLWQPKPESFGEMYESAMKEIGSVTGIGFRTGNLAKTVDLLTRRGVKVSMGDEESDGRFARFWDLDKNVLFIAEPRRLKDRRSGLLAVDFVTVASRDAARSGEFFRKALGMRGRTPSGERFAEFRVSPKGTAIVPFTPTSDMYDNKEDYEADLAHIGEETSISFEAEDIYGLQDTLLARGVRFKEKAEKRPWGGIAARFFDPDDNVYRVYEME